MKTDTINFLEALLFNAEGQDNPQLDSKTVYDFTPKFTEAVDKFVSAFRDHLERTGFPMEKLDASERSFGGNVYLSLSGAGVGFFDDNDEAIAELHERLKTWAGAFRFEDLANMLDVGEDGKIDLSFISSAIEKYRDEYFGVPVGSRSPPPAGQHTPGPWRTGCCFTSVEVRPAGWNVPMVIADCHTKLAPESSEERLANARLIVSAPELLAALQALLIVADHPNNPLATGACASIIADARQAIAKATGQGGTL
jgi:hypothetical protein